MTYTYNTYVIYIRYMTHICVIQDEIMKKKRQD